ncbi:MAG: AMP-binding protein [Phycisphaerales bacterium]|nr:AMP-binding protein [Phycisphaerales bacterium]
MSIHWPIIRNCLRFPRRIAVIDDQRRWRAIELLVGAMHLADAITHVNHSRTVGLLLPTSGLFPMAALAGWISGKTIVPLNYLLKADDLQYVVDDCDTDTIITVQPMLDFLAEPPRGPRIIRLEDVSFKGLPRLRWPRRAGKDNLAAILYTSGTSGKPKGVMLTHGNLSANIRQIVEWVRFTRVDSFLGVLPAFHSFGLTVLTLLPLTIGAKVIYTARFVPKRIVELMRTHRPDVIVAIPSMYNALLTVKKAEPADFASLRYTVSGAEPLPDAVFERFRERYNVTINEGYGLTETSPATHWCRPEEFRRHSVGKPIPRVVQRIVDPVTGRECAVNEEGEIRLAGPNIMKGYYKLPEQTREAFSDDGMFRTGDIGRIDEEGYLFITGRLKEMLIIGGENVFPREIEEVLNGHESISASAVIGQQDPSRGEVPIAFVELNEGCEFDEQALRSRCRESLAQYKVPREIRCVETLPRSPTGKILRRELKNTL